MATRAPGSTRRAAHRVGGFKSVLLQQLDRAKLSSEAQEALLAAVNAAAPAGPTAKAAAPAIGDVEGPDLARWLPQAPASAAKLEFEALQARFSLRRQLLSGSIGSSEVVALLGVRNRQTVLDRLRSGTLLGVRDQGQWRFPLWQFDPDGPDGVVDGLPAVLAVLAVSDLAKVRWLQQPRPVFAGATALQLLQRGGQQQVLQEAAAVGCGQD